MQVQEVDENKICLGPLTSQPGLRVCLNPDEPQGKGLFPVCLVDENGGLFAGLVSSTQWIEGAGWTHSETPRSRSTLSADGEIRCARAPAPSLGETCP